MIVYRPVAPLTPGRPGLVSTLAAMALTVVLGTTWQIPIETSTAPDEAPETAGRAVRDADPGGP